MEMKKFIIPILLLAVVSCEKNLDFQKVVEAPATLVYVAEAGSDNVQKGSVVVLPDGFITSEKRFQVNVNSSLHPATTATMSVDNSLVDAYNSANGTAYPALPAANFSVSLYVRPEPAPAPAPEEGGEATPGEEEPAEEPEVDNDPFSPSASATVNIAENERLSDEFIRLRLGGDLDALTEEYYMVALQLSCPDLTLSAKKQEYYLLVNVSDLAIKPITSTSEMTGTQVDNATRRTFTADVSSSSNLFDNNTNSYVNWNERTGNEVTIDLQEERNFSGISIRGYSYVYPTIERVEISTDGVEFRDCGDIGEGDTLTSGTQCYLSLYGGKPTRYVRLTFGMSSSYWDYGYHVIAEIYIYTAD